MLENLTRNFRELLKQFGGGICPLCAVLKRREREEIERVDGKDRSNVPLCARHLEIALTTTADAAARARRSRGALEACLGGNHECGVCARLGRIELRLARSIGRLDGSMRFRKALEAAPVFCRKHAGFVAAGAGASNFAQVQRVKVLRLRDALAQAELRTGEDLESLISRAIAYLAPPLDEDSVAKVEDLADCVEKEAMEFERWDEARLVRHLGALESEAASLRYRNAVLSEENRRLKLAHAAGEATRRDLERDRQELLAAVNEERNPLKPSGQR